MARSHGLRGGPAPACHRRARVERRGGRHCQLRRAGGRAGTAHHGGARSWHQGVCPAADRGDQRGAEGGEGGGKDVSALEDRAAVALQAFLDGRYDDTNRELDSIAARIPK